MSLPRCTRVLPAAVLFCALSVLANTGPIVSAGVDTTTRLGRTFNFYGTAEDADVLPDGTLNVLWRQIQGPGSGAQIFMSDAISTMVSFSQTGIYVFELSANDGELSAYDTMKVEVLDSIPFKITAPAAGERIPLGSTYLITWQIDPPRTDVTVELSTDLGQNYEYIVLSRISDNKFEWHVSDTLPLSDSCLVRVLWYKDHTREAISGLFSLVAPNSSVKWYQDDARQAGSGETSLNAPGSSSPKRSGCGTGAGLALFPLLGCRFATWRRQRRNPSTRIRNRGK